MKYVRTFRAFDSREIVQDDKNISRKQFKCINVTIGHGAKINFNRFDRVKVCL